MHIRRGDYKEWNGGKYYYSDDVYFRIMKELEEQAFDNGVKLQFILFSNEKVDISHFSLKSNVFVSKMNAIEDHWLMSNCDYLLGPPSTFTRWQFIWVKRSSHILNPQMYI